MTDCSLVGGNGEVSQPPLFVYGFGGPGVAITDSDAWLLECSVLAGTNGTGSNGWVAGYAVQSYVRVARARGSALNVGAQSTVQTIDDFPSLSVTATAPAVGDIAILTTAAEPGSSARIYAGRFPRVDVIGPGIDLPWLHSRERGASLNALPASGERAISFTIAPVPRGTLIFGQSSRVLANGNTQLSNGAVIVVR